MCVGEHMCALVVFVFVFPGHEHGWFRVRVGHDEVLVVRMFGFVNMWMWCLGLGVCCSPYPAICTIQFSPFVLELCIVWVCPPSPPVRPPSQLFTCHASKINLRRLLDVVSRTLVPSKSNLWADWFLFFWTHKRHGLILEAWQVKSREGGLTGERRWIYPHNAHL